MFGAISKAPHLHSHAVGQPKNSLSLSAYRTSALLFLQPSPRRVFKPKNANKLTSRSETPPGGTRKLGSNLESESFGLTPCSPLWASCALARLLSHLCLSVSSLLSFSALEVHNGDRKTRQTLSSSVRRQSQTVKNRSFDLENIAESKLRRIFLFGDKQCRPTNLRLVVLYDTAACWRRRRRRKRCHRRLPGGRRRQQRQRYRARACRAPLWWCGRDSRPATASMMLPTNGGSSSRRPSRPPPGWRGPGSGRGRPFRTASNKSSNVGHAPYHQRSETRMIMCKAQGPGPRRFNR